MAGIDPQTQQIINSMTQNISNTVSRAMQDIVQRLGNVSSMHADDMSKSMKRSASLIGGSMDAFGNRVKDVADVLKDAKFDHAVDHMRDQLQKRIKNESSFVDQDKIIKGDLLRAQAEYLQRNREAAAEALRDLRKSTEEAVKERADAEKRRSRMESAATKAKQQSAAAAARVEARRNNIASLEAQHRLAVTNTDKASIQAQIDSENAANDLDEKSMARKQRLIDAYEDVAKTVKDIDAGLKNHADQEAKLQKTMRETVDKLQEVADDIDKNRPAEAIQRWKKGIEDGIKNKLFSGALVTAGLKNLGGEIRTGIDRGVGMLSVGEQASVTNLGMSPKEFMEASGEYRSAMIAAGGMGKSLSALEGSVKNLRGHVASNAEAAKFNMQQMQMMATMGIQPTEQRLKKMGNAFKSLHQITGMTADQFNTSMRDIMENEDALQQMRMANTEQEREAIQDSILARYKENRERGISDEQTRAMIKKQQQMGNEKPLTRYQKAVKHAMLGGAMGVAGSSELIQLSMIPEGKKTKAQQAREAQLRGDIDKGVNQGLNSNDFGTQLMTGELAEKTDWSKDMSVFNTKTTEAVAKGIKEGFGDTFGKMNNTLVAGNAVYEKLAGIMQNSWVQMGIGIAGLLASFGLNSLATHLNTAALKANTLALARSAISGAKDMLPDRSPGNGKWKPTMPKGGRLAGGIAGMVVGTVGGAYMDGKAVEAEEKDDKKAAAGWDTGSAALAGAGWGATIGSVIPGIGTAVGAGVGAVAGGAYGLYQNRGALFGSKDTQKQEATVKPEAKPTEEVKKQQAEIKATIDTFNTQQTENTRTVQETMKNIMVPISQRSPSQQQQLAQLATQEVNATKTGLSSEGFGSILAGDDGKSKKPTDLGLATIDQQLAQIQRMTEANKSLERIANGTDTMIDIAKKQLLAATLSDDEKKEVTKKNSFRNGAMTGLSNYQYI